MTQETATFESTEEELREAGASEEYIQYYLTAKEMGKPTASTNHADRVVNRDVSYSGGSFHDALWDGEERFPIGDNPYGADLANTRILEKAGVY